MEEGADGQQEGHPASNLLVSKLSQTLRVAADQENAEECRVTFSSLPLQELKEFAKRLEEEAWMYEDNAFPNCQL
eukprot:CAMPEP_0177632918 /NCGR_PEP_ID=MMETSP0447-20121125/2558_1 /TAXON_ID=0 /ORGANISM="Stygamoeba regulata, Strain BSH-02190019" /LENGTH=74 /DNA_ID=CAMNT_0019134539 /DNA_START=54 /DNA_END=278 /DNA_ORIENTATION=+